VALFPGAWLGVYEVVALLGEGGMGQIYRARDTTLNREVALTILTEAFCRRSGSTGALHARGANPRGAQSPQHRTHPRRGSGGVRALVVELVEGEDLSQLITRGPVPIDDVVAETDDSWFWAPAVLDLQTNQATRVPMNYAGDAEVDPAWDGDRHITVLARRTESTIWRFERSQN